jgi:hypothetical protein
MPASPEYVESILSRYEQAAAANRHTPGRRGCVVELTPELADEAMITGDIHGHRPNFNRILHAAALDEHPRRHLVLQEVCHGGPAYSQGGCMSHGLLEDVAALKAQYPQRVHFLLGNHELAELTDYAIQKNRQLLNLQFRMGLQQMYGEATGRVHAAAMRFLWSCPLAVRLPGGAFIAHSLPDGADRRPFDPSALTRELSDDDCREQSDVFRLLWGRDYRQENAHAFCKQIGARLLLTGHEPCPEGCVAPNDSQVILDCCGDSAAYVILPVGETLDQAEIMRRVRWLE